MKIRLFVISIMIITVVTGQTPLNYTDLSGYSNSLPDDRMIIVEIFATWCENCQAQHSDLFEVYTNYNSFPLYSLSSSSKDNISDVKSYNVSYPTPWTIGMDTDGQLFEKYKVEGYPTFLVLEGDDLKACLVGVQSKETLTDIFNMVEKGESSITDKYGTSCSIGGNSSLLLWGLGGSLLIGIYFIWSGRRKK